MTFDKQLHARNAAPQPQRLPVAGSHGVPSHGASALSSAPHAGNASTLDVPPWWREKLAGGAVAWFAAGVQSFRLGGMVLSSSPLLQVQGEGRHCHSRVPNLS